MDKPTRIFTTRWSTALVYLGFGALAPVAAALFFLSGNAFFDASSLRFGGDMRDTGGAMAAVGLFFFVLAGVAFCKGLGMLAVRPKITMSAEGVKYRYDLFFSRSVPWAKVVGVLDTDTKLILETREEAFEIPNEFKDFQLKVETARRYSGHH